MTIHRRAALPAAPLLLTPAPGTDAEPARAVMPESHAVIEAAGRALGRLNGA